MAKFSNALEGLPLWQLSSIHQLLSIDFLGYDGSQSDDHQM